MKRTILVLTLTLLLSSAAPARAATVTGDQITPGGNLPAAGFNITPYINDAPSGISMWVSLLALLY